MRNPTGPLVQILLALADILPDAFAQAKNPKIRRYDCIIGLIGEPFWFWYGYRTEQWAFSLLGGFFLIVCAYGFYHKWIKGDLTYGEEIIPRTKERIYRELSRSTHSLLSYPCRTYRKKTGAGQTS